MAKKTKTEKKTEQIYEPKERVTVFGDEWQERRDKYGRKPHGSFAGIFFISAGILLLLNTLQIIPWYVWNHIWRFWPVILIFWGLQIILGWSAPGRWFANLIGAIFVILVVLFAIHQVNPLLIQGLPPVFDQIFNIMKGVQR